MLYQPEEFPQSSAAASAVDSEDTNAGMELGNQENEEIDISSLLDLDLEVVTVTVPAEPTGAFAGESEVATTVSIEELVSQTVQHCRETGKDSNPVEILRYFQSLVVTGRSLEVTDTRESPEGSTNFIMVDRFNILQTGLDEIRALSDKRLTLEVQFYNEVRITRPPVHCIVRNSYIHK